jgi:NADPH-dependent F420 reductase
VGGRYRGARCDQAGGEARIVSRMRIGLVGGTGPAGRALALRMASVGFDVVIGSRSKDRAAEVRDRLAGRWPDRTLPLDAAANDEAATAELVVVATPWDAASETVRALEEPLAGKVVVCMANALVRMGAEFQALVPPRGSVAANVQAALPRSLVAAAFHHLPAREVAALDAPLEGDVLVCSDHEGAFDVLAGCIGRIPRLRALDAGTLSSAPALESFTAVLLQLNARYRTRVGVKLTGIDEQ